MKRNLHIETPLLFGLLLLLAGAVDASAQDGGVRSLFATGTGLRGLAMGGAQAAITHDAEALAWNPAGLAHVRRNEFTLGRTSYFGEGVTESQVAAVLPSWRWGGVAAGVRHIGVSGVEGRDDRNQVTDSDLSASALQVALGYGRNLGGWSLGTSLELERDQVAGSGASGFGLDLGVQLRPIEAFSLAPDWMEGVSLGAAWTNVIEPTIRIEEDSVVDPSGFRFGVGYERPILSSGSLTAAIDLETSAVTDTRFHTGLELKLHPALALRSGLGEHGPTAGAGFHWSDFDLDYVLEDTDLGSVHRIGLSYSVGRTTEDRRLAYVTREEEALQSRLEDASARRELERIGRLLAEAESLLAAGRLDDALATVDVIRTLAPDREDAVDVEVRCWMARGQEHESRESYTEAALAFARALALAPDFEEAALSQERVQAESDRIAKRAESLRAQYASALDAFGRGDLLRARDGFAALVDGKRKDAEAEAMLRRTDDAISRKADDHLDQARRLLARNLLQEAGAELEQARQLAPKLGALVSAEADLNRRRALASARVDANWRDPSAGTTSAPVGSASRAATVGEGEAGGEAVVDPLASGRDVVSASSGSPHIPNGGASRSTEQGGTAMDAAELLGLYRRGIEASQAERSEDAVRYFELVHSASPGYAQVRENLVREYLTLGMDRFARGDLDDAIDIWQRAIEVDPQDDKARGYLERALRHRDRSQEILGATR